MMLITSQKTIVPWNRSTEERATSRYTAKDTFTAHELNWIANRVNSPAEIHVFGNWETNSCCSICKFQISRFPIGFHRRPYNTVALPCECVMRNQRGGRCCGVINLMTAGGVNSFIDAQSTQRSLSISHWLHARPAERNICHGGADLSPRDRATRCAFGDLQLRSRHYELQRERPCGIRGFTIRVQGLQNILRFIVGLS